MEANEPKTRGAKLSLMFAVSDIMIFGGCVSVLEGVSGVWVRVIEGDAEGCEAVGPEIAGEGAEEGARVSGALESAGFLGTGTGIGAGVIVFAGVRAILFFAGCRPKISTAKVSARFWIWPVFIANPISLKFGFKILSRCVGEFIQARKTVSVSVNPIARFSPA